VTSLENSVKRGDVKNQQFKVYRTLASFWGDSVRLFEPYAYYTAEAAKLENSEKSLTFAAHLFLTNLKTESDPPMQNWLATNAKDLFQRALQLNPKNDSSKIGLGACYIFGNISDNPMEGIAAIREVVQRDPDNMFGQLILGLGGVKSGQFDRAIERFKIIVAKQPDNMEAALNLAESYDQKGDKENAVKWYKEVKSRIPNPEAQKELDTRIKALQ
jgi:thioredoxin-like negative regulator of GroEL